MIDVSLDELLYNAAPPEPVLNVKRSAPIQIKTVSHFKKVFREGKLSLLELRLKRDSVLLKPNTKPFFCLPYIDPLAIRASESIHSTLFQQRHRIPGRA